MTHYSLVNLLPSSCNIKLYYTKMPYTGLLPPWYLDDPMLYLRPCWSVELRPNPESRLSFFSLRWWSLFLIVQLSVPVSTPLRPALTLWLLRFWVSIQKTNPWIRDISPSLEFSYHIYGYITSRSLILLLKSVSPSIFNLKQN